MDFYKHRLYLIINLIIFIDTLLYGIIVPAVPHFIKTYGIKETMVGMIFFAYSAGLLLSSVPIGVLCDKIGRKKVLLFGSIGLSAATVIYMFSNSFYLLMFSRFLQGVASSATWTAGLALVAEIFPDSNRGQKLGLVLSAAGLGTIVGPAFGGLLFKYLGFTYPFLIIAVLTLTPLILLSNQKEWVVSSSKTEIPDQSSKTSELLNNRNLMWGAITVCVSSLGLGITDPILPIHLNERFGLTSEGIGVIFTIMGIAYSLSQPVMGGLADRIGRKKVMILGLIVTAVAAPFITLAETLAAQGLAVFFLGTATGVISAPCLPLMAESVNRSSMDVIEEPNNMYGVAFGILNTAYSLGLVIGPITGGVITERLSFTYAMGFYSLLLVIAGIGVTKYVRETLRIET